ncbi:hypothetical protein O3G_MSEX011658 [Manduca sexta]|uniref:C2H2-type domain-containing protein n=1 Tax=Manduca sexta TaxID=7130 RepID=A0A921ZLQ8_MANSE|nr:hypothetical protein O3G_MSEX011658 [Manduca sexta]
MMEAAGESICAACLSIGRKMILVDDYSKKQCFMNIINEIPMRIPNKLLICWECNAIITRFIKFKDQVKQSYVIFLEYINKTVPLSSIKTNSKLCNHKLKTVSYQLGIELDNLKQEEPKILQIKEEVDFSDHSDDNRLLIDFKKNKIVAGKVKKKKKRKELQMYKEIELSEQEIAEERRQMALRDDYVNAMFRCEMCLETFPNGEDMKDHVYVKHELNASNFKCSVCECSFSSEVSFNYHKKKHKRRYQCALCGTKHATKRSASKHYGNAHWTSNIIQLSTKDQEMFGKTECIEELEDTKQSEAFPCEFCEKTFRWKTSLRKHLETHRIEAGQKRKPYCEPCRLSFTTSSNLRKHVKTSSKHQIQLKLWKLKQSLPQDTTNPEKEACIQQIKRSVNTAREQYPCPQCDKKFQWRGNLLRHLHSHEARANGELVCEPCNRTFSSIATYKQHMKISKKHVTENDFKTVQSCAATVARCTAASVGTAAARVRRASRGTRVCRGTCGACTGLSSDLLRLNVTLYLVTLTERCCQV